MLCREKPRASRQTGLGVRGEGCHEGARGRQPETGQCWLSDGCVKPVMFSDTQGETESEPWIVSLVVSAEAGTGGVTLGMVRACEGAAYSPKLWGRRRALSWAADLAPPHPGLSRVLSPTPRLQLPLHGLDPGLAHHIGSHGYPGDRRGRGTCPTLWPSSRECGLGITCVP